MKENTMKNSDAYYKYIEKYNETYGHIPSGQYMFILDELDTNKRNITELNNILNKTGVSFNLEAHKTTNGKEYTTLSINVDFNVIDKIQNRKAGRKKEIAQKNISFGELKELQKSMSNKEIIQYLGCSKSAFYRAVKRIEDLKQTTGYDIDDYFLL